MAAGELRVAPTMHCSCPCGELAGRVARGSHFLRTPVEYVVVRVAQLVEETSEQLPQIGVVRLVLKPKRAAEVEVCGKLT